MKKIVIAGVLLCAACHTQDKDVYVPANEAAAANVELNDDGTVKQPSESPSVEASVSAH